LEAPAIVEATKDKCIGIDLGIKDFAICSNGKVYNNPKWIKSYQRRLEIRQRRHNRKQKGSSNKNKSRLLMANIHEKVANQRTDYINKVTHDIVSDNQATNYAIEALNVKGMMQNHKLAGAIGQVGWNMFVNTLKYKASLSGKSVLEIGQFEPSSKMCSKCGNIKSDLKLSDRIYKCDKC
jgi:putative transposase